MIHPNQIIRQADADGVPAATVERDYILSHVLAAIADCEQAEQIVFKGWFTLSNLGQIFERHCASLATWANVTHNL